MDKDQNVVDMVNRYIEVFGNNPRNENNIFSYDFVSKVCKKVRDLEMVITRLTTSQVVMLKELDNILSDKNFR